MTKIQKTILLAGAAVQLIMLLFPPFVFHAPTPATLNQGYSFIFNPPHIGGDAYPTVNVAFLALQAAVVAFMTGLLYLAFRENRHAPR